MSLVLTFLVAEVLCEWATCWSIKNFDNWLEVLNVSAYIKGFITTVVLLALREICRIPCKYAWLKLC